MGNHGLLSQKEVAKQADDDSLFLYAKRIQARAVRRAGELLKQFDGRPNNAKKQSGDAPTLLSQREIAEQSGMSKDQQVTAVRVANVDEEEFENEMANATPPTLTELARRGKKILEIAKQAVII